MLRRTVVSTAAVLVLVSCSSEPPTLRITEPHDGATVTSPFRVSAAVTGFELAVAGPAEEGVGHLHVLIDVGCAKPGTVIQAGEQRLHLWRGETSTELDLPPGEHTICVQAGDGEHVALDLSREITVNVAG